jgi:hypothetical protein
VVSDVSGTRAQIEEQLQHEFGNRVPESTLLAQARDSLARFEDARIMAFVPVLALRDARAHLRGELNEVASGDRERARQRRHGETRGDVTVIGEENAFERVRVAEVSAPGAWRQVQRSDG